MPKRYIQYLGGIVALEEVICSEGLSDAEVKDAVCKYYTKSSKQITKERTKIYQDLLRVKPRSIIIERINRRWGSCNSRKEITYHYLIAILPMELIDYIVVHELCHIFHMNHDRSFWRKIGSIIPDYKSKVKMLERVQMFH